VINLFKKLSLSEQLKNERQRNIELQTKNDELQLILAEQLIDLEFRQILNEMGVNV